jgi:hypothetical protein
VSNVLSGVERAIMLNYLQDNLPKMMIKAISTKYIPSEQNSPTFEPLDLEEKNYSILEQGIIFLQGIKLPELLLITQKFVSFFITMVVDFFLKVLCVM